MNVFLTGYGRGNPPDLLKIAQKHKCAYVLDIRYWRQSKKRPEWSEENLHAFFNQQNSPPPVYLQLSDWGNKGKYQGAIEIADYDCGLETVRNLPGQSLPNPQSAIRNPQLTAALAFCACGKPDNCHRMVISDSLNLEEGITVKHIAFPMPERPLGVYWNYQQKTVEMDPLAKMEEWAGKNPERMTVERYEKLQQTRDEYAACCAKILLIATSQSLLDQGVNLDQIPQEAERIGVSPVLLPLCLRRLAQQKLAHFEHYPKEHVNGLPCGPHAFYWVKGEPDAKSPRRAADRDQAEPQSAIRNPKSAIDWGSVHRNAEDALAGLL